jgi:Astacin (Peptidase family M12A)/Ricin-type beta-trefoil lectin domain-like
MKKIFLLPILTILCISALSQNEYSLQKIRLPFTTVANDVYVKTSGNYYIMNDDIIAGKILQNISAIRTATEGWSYIWPQGYIPVALEDSISLMGFEPAILKALDYLNTNTRLRFKPRTTEENFIFINYQSVVEMGFMGGNSWVGRQGGSQDFNISTTDFRTIVHELLHAAGFWHEQSRHDRDLYINILWDNVRDEAKHNYQIEPGIVQGEYDYMSIMHYWNGAFSKNGNKTMQCKFGDFISDCVMGGSLLSAKDIVGINSTYWFNEKVAIIDFGKEFTTMRDLAQFMNLSKETTANVNDAMIEIKRQPVTDGLYKIKVNQTGKYLAIENISHENWARLVQWDDANQGNHQFYVKKNEDGSYYLSAKHSGKYICANIGNKTEGDRIIQNVLPEYLGKWQLNYSKQQGCTNGWKITYNDSGLPMQLVGVDNGAGFELRAQQHQDGDYDCASTFSFEKLEDTEPTIIPESKKINTDIPMKKKVNRRY